MTDGLIKKRSHYRKVTEYKGIFLERNNKVPGHIRHIHVTWGVEPPTEDEIFAKRDELDKEAKGRQVDNLVTTLIGSVGETMKRYVADGFARSSNAIPLKK